MQVRIRKSGLKGLRQQYTTLTRSTAPSVTSFLTSQPQARHISTVSSPLPSQTSELPTHPTSRSGITLHGLITSLVQRKLDTSSSNQPGSIIPRRATTQVPTTSPELQSRSTHDLKSTQDQRRFISTIPSVTLSTPTSTSTSPPSGASPPNVLHARSEPKWDLPTMLTVGSVHNGFEVVDVQNHPALSMTMYTMKHLKTGAAFIHIDRDDPDNAFCVGFRTPPRDDSGIAHILEHTTLCGSQKYPVRDPFFLLLRRSLNTFMNAMTRPESTFYPFSSQNEKDFKNLLSVYLDAVFFPFLDEADFRQEGHRVEVVRKPDAPPSPEPLKSMDEVDLVYKGVVFNEMKGALSEPASQFYAQIEKYLYPSCIYRNNSGGDPLAIPSLTHSGLKDFHTLHYHPSNAVFFTYGDMNPPLKEVDEVATRRLDFITQTMSLRASHGTSPTPTTASSSAESSTSPATARSPAVSDNLDVYNVPPLPTPAPPQLAETLVPHASTQQHHLTSPPSSTDYPSPRRFVDLMHESVRFDRPRRVVTTGPATGESAVPMEDAMTQDNADEGETKATSSALDRDPKTGLVPGTGSSKFVVCWVGKKPITDVTQPSLLHQDFVETHDAARIATTSTPSSSSSSSSSHPSSQASSSLSMTPEDLVHHSSIDKYLTTPVPIDFAAEAKIASDRVTAKAQTQQSDPSQAIHVSSYETSLKAARERVARMTEEEKTQANLAIEELALGLLSVALIDNPSPVYEILHDPSIGLGPAPMMCGVETSQHDPTFYLGIHGIRSDNVDVAADRLLVALAGAATKTSGMSVQERFRATLATAEGEKEGEGEEADEGQSSEDGEGEVVDGKAQETQEDVSENESGQFQHSSGFDIDLMHDYIHQVELSLKHAKAQFGVKLLMKLVPIYTLNRSVQSPIEAVSTLLPLLKNNIDVYGMAYFRALVAHHLVENPHRLLIRQDPDRDYNKRLLDQEQAQLARLKETLSLDDVYMLEQRARDLKARQDTKPDPNILPTVTIDDVRKEAIAFSLKYSLEPLPHSSSSIASDASSDLSTTASTPSSKIAMQAVHLNSLTQLRSAAVSKGEAANNISLLDSLSSTHPYTLVPAGGSEGKQFDTLASRAALPLLKPQQELSKSQRLVGWSKEPTNGVIYLRASADRLLTRLHATDLAFLPLVENLFGELGVEGRSYEEHQILVNRYCGSLDLNISVEAPAYDLQSPMLRAYLSGHALAERSQAMASLLAESAFKPDYRKKLLDRLTRLKGMIINDIQDSPHRYAALDAVARLPHLPVNVLNNALAGVPFVAFAVALVNRVTADLQRAKSGKRVPGASHSDMIATSTGLGSHPVIPDMKAAEGELKALYNEALGTKEPEGTDAQGGDAEVMEEMKRLANLDLPLTGETNGRTEGLIEEVCVDDDAEMTALMKGVARDTQRISVTTNLSDGRTIVARGGEVKVITGEPTAEDTAAPLDEADQADLREAAEDGEPISIPEELAPCTTLAALSRHLYRTNTRLFGGDALHPTALTTPTTGVALDRLMVTFDGAVDAAEDAIAANQSSTFESAYQSVKTLLDASLNSGAVVESEEEAKSDMSTKGLCFPPIDTSRPSAVREYLAKRNDPDANASQGASGEDASVVFSSVAIEEARLIQGADAIYREHVGVPLSFTHPTANGVDLAADWLKRAVARHSTEDGISRRYNYLALPIQVNHCVMAFRAVEYAHEDAAPLTVLGQLMNDAFLHREIREKGGAYGSGARFDFNGAFRLTSFRDPRVLGTLEDFWRGIAWAKNEPIEGVPAEDDEGWNYSERHVSEAKLSVFGSLDAPQSPSARGVRPFFGDLSYAQRQRFRDQLFAVTRRDVARVAAKYLVRGREVVTVAGSSDMIPTEVMSDLERNDGLWMITKLNLS